MALEPGILKYLIFDLDDTLFDTHGLLVVPASRESCAAMIGAGLDTSIEECGRARDDLLVRYPRQDVYKLLVKKFGIRGGCDPENVAHAGFDAFFNRTIKEKLALFPEAEETLEKLSKKFDLFLVTLGTPKTQKEKVARLGVERFFLETIYVDVAHTQSKAAALTEILQKTGSQPKTHASIGNRLDSEIAEGKALGMQTILFIHGEYAHLRPQSSNEIPDATIHQISQLQEILL